MKFIIEGCEPGISGGLTISQKESVEDFSMARARARMLVAQRDHPIVRIVAEGRDAYQGRGGCGMMDSSKTVGIYYRSDSVEWSLVIALWWGTLVVRRDMGENEIFSVRNGYAKSVAACGVRAVWRKS